MNILIYGAGAVGCYVGGHLAMGGHRVTLLARGQMAQALQTRGLTLRSAQGLTTDVEGLSVFTSPEEAFASTQFDWLAFTMKAYDTVAAIHELEAILPKPPPILCLQNGVGNEESLVSAFGSDRVVAGTLTTPLSVVVPGVVAEEKRRGLMLSDELQGSRRILSAFEQTALDVRTAPRGDSIKWSKLLLNQLGNATSAILDMPPEAIYANPDLFAVERAALLETLGVMRARKIPVINLPGTPSRLLARLARRLPPRLLQALLIYRIRRGRGGKMPSLHQGLAGGRRRSEVIWLNGAVARAADAIDLIAPVNHVLALTLMDIHEGRAPWEQFRNRPEMLLAAVRVAT